MARTVPTLKTKLMSRKDACESLGISQRSFDNHWQTTFTDPRPKEDRRPRVARRVYEDELAIAVEAGGGVSSKAKAAVLAYRSQIKRTW